MPVYPKVPQGQINWGDRSYSWECNHVEGAYSISDCPWCCGYDLQKILASLKTSRSQVYYGNLKAFLRLKGKEIWAIASALAEEQGKFVPVNILELSDLYGLRSRIKIITEWLEDIEFIPTGTYERMKYRKFQPMKYPPSNADRLEYLQSLASRQVLSERVPEFIEAKKPTKRLLIFDKDGTLVDPLSGKTFPQHPRDQKDIPGILEAVRHYQNEGYVMAIASNQAGVLCNYKTLDEAIEEMEYCLEIFPEIECGVFCPDEGETLIEVCRQASASNQRIYSHQKVVRKEGQSPFQKPSAGMIDYLVNKYDANREEALFVGDRCKDEQAAINAGIGFISVDVITDKFLQTNEQNRVVR